MLKGIQIKIILAFSIVGIIAITAFGYISVNNLQELQNIAIQATENIRNKWKYWKSNLSNEINDRSNFSRVYIFNDINGSVCFKGNNCSNFQFS